MNEIELDQELVKINSENPPGNEKEIAKFVYDYLSDIKLSPELIKFGEDRYNVVASVGKGNGLMLSSHMDTVPIGTLENWKYDPLSGKIVDGKIFGRGASDAKGGIAVILTAAKNLSKNKFKKNLLLVFTGDEEVAQRGALFLIKNRKDVFRDVKYGVVADSDMKINIAQKGPLHIKFIFKGKAAHGSRPHLGVNAILKATKFVEEVDRQSKKLTAKDDLLLGRGTVSIGKISGGTKVNIVPDQCEVEIDRRLTYGESVKFGVDQFKEILNELNLQAQAEFTGAPREAVKLPKDSLIIKVFKQVSGLPIDQMSGYTEMELFYSELGIESVVCGVGNNSAHTANEFVKLSDLKKARTIFENLIKKWCL